MAEVRAVDGLGSDVPDATRCYLRLADNPRAREALRQYLPKALMNPQLTSQSIDDAQTKALLNTLLEAVGGGVAKHEGLAQQHLHSYQGFQGDAMPHAR